MTSLVLAMDRSQSNFPGEVENNQVREKGLCTVLSCYKNQIKYRTPQVKILLK